MRRFDPSKLARLRGEALSAVGYRHQSRSWDPRSGEGARRFGGRFNAPHSFPVVYLCTSRRCAVAELTRQARRQNLEVEDLLPRELWSLSVELEKVLDLKTEATLTALGLDRRDLVREDLRLTREIGEAAHEHGFQAIRSPSATGVDDILALMPENLAGAVVAAELIEEWASARNVGGAG